MYFKQGHINLNINFYFIWKAPNDFVLWITLWINIFCVRFKVKMR